MRYVLTFILALTLVAACGDDETEADAIGVGASCSVDDDCNQEDGDQFCLDQFKGGYCGIEGCMADADCPEASACVAHTDGNNYCFRLCVDKAECNANRGAEEEANCSANITFADGNQSGKACVPPSG